ncbi:HAD family phosphatase [Oceanithermus sp.]|uniref:HAD family hydrolase n=1 Tax=Oceanithermus sp. TaxID=2268145 RepID=UPI0025E5FEE3|nr:HAD family phosphatase [Oceanithermus sp.]
MKPSGILFDWGGVFTVGTFDGRVVRNTARRFGLDEERVARAYFAEVRRLELGEWGLARFWTYFAEALGVEAPYAEFEALFLSSVAPRREMYEVLAAIPAEVVVGLLSNNYPVISDFLRAGEGFDRFDAVFFSNEEGLKKPDARAFEVALERMGLPAGEVLFVDDHPDNIAAAEDLGLMTHRFEATEPFVRELERRGLRLPAAPNRP